MVRQSFPFLIQQSDYLLEFYLSSIARTRTRPHAHIHTMLHAPCPLYRSVVGPARPPPHTRSRCQSGVVVRRLAQEVVLAFQSQSAPRRYQFSMHVPVHELGGLGSKKESGLCGCSSCSSSMQLSAEQNRHMPQAEQTYVISRTDICHKRHMPYLAEQTHAIFSRTKYHIQRNRHMPNKRNIL